MLCLTNPNQDFLVKQHVRVEALYVRYICDIIILKSVFLRELILQKSGISSIEERHYDVWLSVFSCRHMLIKQKNRLKKKIKKIRRTGFARVSIPRNFLENFMLRKHCCPLCSMAEIVPRSLPCDVWSVSDVMCYCNLISLFMTQ